MLKIVWFWQGRLEETIAENFVYSKDSDDKHKTHVSPSKKVMLTKVHAS
jgi:hypothetical protein